MPLNPSDNPFVLLTGSPPPVLAGRRRILDFLALEAERTVRGTPSAPVVLLGVRGVGKTALLAHERRRLSLHPRYLVVRHEANGSANDREDLVRGILSSAESLRGKASSSDRGVDSFGFGVGLDGVSVSVTTSKKDRDVSLSVKGAVVALVSEAREKGLSVAILIDEAQLLDHATISEIAQAVQWAGSDPSESARGGLFLVLGGLPEVRQVLGRAVSYSERFRYETIGGLSDEDAAYAVTEPLRRAGVAYEPGIVDPVVTEVGGYPHFTQVFGYHLWNYARGLSVCVSDLPEAFEEARRYIRDSVYASRLARASDREKDLLFAMAKDEGGFSQVRDLAERLGKKDARGISSLRESLLGKGVVFSPKPGVLEFTVPGFAEFLRQSER